MNNATGARAIDLKWFGKVTPRQALWVASAFAFALGLTALGFGHQCMCLGMLMIAAILYMLPRTQGVENVRLMALVGAVFTVAAVLVGSLVVAPSVLDGNQGDPPDNDYFTGVAYTRSADGIEINAVFTGDTDASEVVFKYGVVQGIGFGPVLGDTDMESVLALAPDGTVSGSVKLDSGSLYMGYLTAMTVDPSGEKEPIDDSDTSKLFLALAYDGDPTVLCLYGCLAGVLPITLMFFLIMVLSDIMRKRMEAARERMEKEGRLYPKGYGRCEECGSVVLPGEVNCRKCGAYIDRPDEMKPDKKDFFECTDCGAEVPMDAKTCPKCGAEFDEDEFEVVHPDGTVETTGEAFKCPECGELSPAAATFCIRCGANFKKK
ncbi:MAG: zinc-ribbon domain-containing protein [Methanomassiliicoccaceae archaeon]|nr:zinc-ribbon domain-containing protein [Methanomassiliicoccaceae archaeon]